ncbi:hypothetical protein BVI1335_680011 [Burkholderia vietnamiensis]|nr:hypothetical protein BVI1335_680011 [Burkholderia vietnamiensis]
MHIPESDGMTRAFGITRGAIARERLWHQNHIFVR